LRQQKVNPVLDIKALNKLKATRELTLKKHSKQQLLMTRRMDDCSLVCPVGHSRGRALVETLLKVKEELEEHRRESSRSPCDSREMMAKTTAEPTASVVQLHHRLNQMEEKIDLITEVLVTTIQQLKLTNQASPSKAIPPANTTQRHSLDEEDGDLTFKLEEVMSQMTQELAELSQGSADLMNQLSKTKMSPQETEEKKKQLVMKRKLMVKREQQMRSIRAFYDVLIGKEKATQTKSHNKK